MADTRALEKAQEFVNFVNNSPTPYHAVDTVKVGLRNAGFKEIQERSNWKEAQLKKGGKYFVTRNGSSLIGFTIGDKFANGNGISIVGAHTDSPCLRIKPISKKIVKDLFRLGLSNTVDSLPTRGLTEICRLREGSMLTTLKPVSMFQN